MGGGGGEAVFTVCSVSDEVHLGYTKKDNDIMWVSAINIFNEKKSGQVCIGGAI